MNNTVFRSVFVIVLFSFVLVAPVSAKAPTLAPSPIATSSPMPVEYVLPFPGLLPTHPMYFLKVIRDKVMEMLISDQITKADFYIHQADKKLNMGVALMTLKQSGEAKKAFEEANAARTQAVENLESHAASGASVPPHIVEKLARSLEKHAEVLQQYGENTAPVEALQAQAARL